MSTLTIKYNNIDTSIQYQSNDSLEEIFRRFKNKINAEDKEFFYLYHGEQITDESITVSELTSDTEIIILANDIYKTTIIKKLIKSDYVICPTCKLNAILESKDYKLKIYGCENEHTTENILINQFNNLQEIDYSEIICQNCSQKRNKTYNNQFYYCCECEINLCPMCKSSHKNNHKIINYNDKCFKCTKHDKEYGSFCNRCKKNICMMCENNHRNNHKKDDLIYYGDLIIVDKEIKNYMKEIKKEIDIFTNDINEKINKLNKIIESINEYYEIINHIIEKYIKDKKVNYQILFSINNIIKNNNIINNIKIINQNKSKDNDIYNKIYNDIFNINNKRDDNIIRYKINKNKNLIKIFGREFVDKNKNIVKLEIEGNEFELMEYYKTNEKIKNNLEIKIKGIENITNMNYMFDRCSSLLSLPDISKWNTCNVIDMSYMFSECSALLSLPDISKWNTDNVTNMSYMFSGCLSLSSLPDISTWKTNKVTNMSYMFNGCSSLSNLPDISTWDTKNIINMSYMFSGCSSLSNLPDLSKWSTINSTDLSCMFYGCSLLKNLPDISKWNTMNTNNMRSMFYGCSLLKNLPDLSKWITINVTDMSCMFAECSSLSSLPDISKWNTQNVINMSFMFNGCSKSLKIPKKFK